jgi:hypothetical protein
MAPPEHISIQPRMRIYDDATMSRTRMCRGAHMYRCHYIPRNEFTNDHMDSSVSTKP